MYINAREIIIILFTEKWIGSVPIFKILGIFSFIYTIPTILVTPINALGHSGANLKVEIYKKSLYLFAIPIAFYFDIYAYIFAICVAAIIGMFLNSYLIQKYLYFNLLDQLKLFFKYFIPFGILVVIDYFVPLGFIENNFLTIVFKSSIYVVLYVGCHFLFKSPGFIDFNNTFIKVFVTKIKGALK